MALTLFIKFKLEFNRNIWQTLVLIYEVLISEFDMANISFDKEWAKAVVQINGRITKTLAQAAKKLFSDIIYTTPVLTGYLRGNWQCSLEAPVNRAIFRRDKSGAAAIAEVISIVNTAKTLKDIYFTNNAPYAERIEFEGYSKLKAPAGMVRVNTIRWPEIVNSFAQKNKD